MSVRSCSSLACLIVSTQRQVTGWSVCVCVFFYFHETFFMPPSFRPAQGPIQDELEKIKNDVRLDSCRISSFSQPSEPRANHRRRRNMESESKTTAKPKMIGRGCAFLPVYCRGNVKSVIRNSGENGKIPSRPILLAFGGTGTLTALGQKARTPVWLVEQN